MKLYQNGIPIESNGVMFQVKDFLPRPCFITTFDITKIQRRTNHNVPNRDKFPKFPIIPCHVNFLDRQHQRSSYNKPLTLAARCHHLFLIKFSKLNGYLRYLWLT